jgi:glutamate-ammonia-ligase adenylyltransferase
MEELRADLSSHSEEGYAYRVDLRLRPYGKSGPLLHSIPALDKYYLENAALWEIQALLKISPIAGNRLLGERFMEKRRSWLSGPRNAGAIRASIHRLRELAIKNRGRFYGKDIKNGNGGIRDIEFLLQGLQLIHIHRRPEILSSNSIETILKLEGAAVIDHATAEQLQADYLLLRRIEHFLQIYEDRQVHALPVKMQEREALAKRIAPDMSPESFFTHLDTIFTRVQEIYSRYLGPRS